MQIAAVFGNVPHHCSRNDNEMQQADYIKTKRKPAPWWSGRCEPSSSLYLISSPRDARRDDEHPSAGMSLLVGATPLSLDETAEA